MSQDLALTYERLNELWENTSIPILNTKGNKFVLFSDMHLGDGGRADDFYANEDTLKTALEFYKENGYKLILLGDIEEFWQFDQDQIKDCYNRSIYECMRGFKDENVFRIYGNHDMDWQLLTDPAKNNPIEIGNAEEAIKLRDLNDNVKILLVHGNQGSTESDKYSWSSRFWVRHFKKIEPFVKFFGLTKHSSATKSRIVREYEGILYSWAKHKKVILICGHSHRAIFASKSYIDRLDEEIAILQKGISQNRENKKYVKANLKEIKSLQKKKKNEKKKKRDISPIEPEGKPLPCYFNTGCGLYSDGVTCIEIADDIIQLGKWQKLPQEKPHFELFDNCSGKLSEYSKIVSQG